MGILVVDERGGRCSMIDLDAQSRFQHGVDSFVKTQPSI